jgi:serine/threonine-protein kinase HipA
VGELVETPQGADFQISSAYWRLVPRPILGQRFEDNWGRRLFKSGLGKRLPGFFANLTPEGELRRIIAKTSDLGMGDDFGLLAHVGEDLPGAVVVRPAESGDGSPADPEVPLPTPKPDQEDGDELRFSLAGVQLKFSMLREAEKLTLPVRGRTGEWIVKLESRVFADLPENEYSMLQWARACGFEVPECRLHRVEDLVGFVRELARPGSSVLALRRYDRAGEERIHQEDFAQVVGLQPEEKYEQVTYDALARLVREILGEDGLKEYLRRLAFVIGSGNGDAHLKNWSLIYPDRIRARWSPLYDQVSTIAWLPERTLALKLAGVKEFNRLDVDGLRRLAQKAGLDPEKTVDIVLDTLVQMQIAWQFELQDLPLPTEHREALAEHWRSVPLLRRFGPLP